MDIFRTKKKARALGCTHYARFMGIIPGFIEEREMLWVSRSDLLNPIEDALCWFWIKMREMRGEEPDFMFEIGQQIK